MKPFLCCFVIAAAFLSGCANPSIKMSSGDRQALQAVRVNPVAVLPADAFYQGPAQSWGIGLGGVIGAAVASSGFSHKGSMVAMLKSPKVDIARLIPSMFTRELIKSGKLAVTDGQQASIPVLNIEVLTYGLGQTQGLSSTLYPTLTMKAQILDPHGKVLWQQTDFITPQNKANDIGAEFEAFMSSPRMMKESFEHASAALSRMLIEEL